MIEKHNHNFQRYAWLVTISLMLVLVLPVLVQDGMFMDGMLYATVSKNLSHGIGSFWFPHYSSTLYPYFDQQPPLGFGIQAVFFSVLGDSIYVERFYSLLCMLVTAWLISLLWRVFHRNQIATARLSWFPVLLWITIPVCFWSYSNNVLENTMGIFDLAAVLLVAKFFKTAQKTHYLLLAGLFVFMASMTKGIQGTFPLAAVFFGWLVYRNISFGKMLMASLLLLSVPFIFYLGLLQNHQAYTSLGTYLDHRVLNSIQHVSEVSNRFYLAGRLLQELIPCMAVTLVLWLVRKKTQAGTASPHLFKHDIFFLLCIGISASFPLMVTMEQRGFYLTTSLPYFALAFALVSAPVLGTLVSRIRYTSAGAKTFRIFAVLLLPLVLVYAGLQINKTSRDHEMIHDTRLIGQNVPHGTVVGSTDALWRDWALQEYLVRHYYICMADTIVPANRFMVVASPADIPAGIQAEKVEIPTVKYHLYRKTRE